MSGYCNEKIKCILIVVFWCVAATVCSGQELSDTDLLRLIADGYEDNLTRLRTWTGSAVREAFDEGGEGEGDVKWSERLEFLADRDQKANLWRGNRIRQSEEINQTIELNSGMNKGGYTYKMDFLGDRSGNYSDLRRGTLLIYNEEVFPKGIFTPSFDPIRELTVTLGVDGQLGGALRVWADDIENNPGPEGSYQIIREDSKVTLILYSIDDAGKVNKNCFSLYAFDLKKGYSLVESHDLDAQGDESHWTLDYEEHNGVYVPNKITAKLVDGKNKSSAIRNILLSTKSVNEEIPSSEFQFEKLGLHPGDYILDHSAGGLRYRWKAFDVIEDDVEAILDSMVKDTGDLTVSQIKDEQLPEVIDNQVLTEEYEMEVNLKLHTDNKVGLKRKSGKIYFSVIAVLAAVALFYTTRRVIRKKR